MSDAVSDFIVKGSLGILLLFSAITWALVIVKALQHWRVKRQNATSAGVVSKASGLPTANDLKGYEGPFVRLAGAGSVAWEDASETVGTGSEEIAIRRDFLERSLRRQIQKERRAVEAGLAVLASIGTTSPFVGLFGTVWGIMHALRRITSFGSASLEVVAGPIGEALIATGIGIAVAVPAVLAYNYFVRRLKLFAAELEDFANTLVDAALRGVYLHGKDASAHPRSARIAETRKDSSVVPREASA